MSKVAINKRRHIAKTITWRVIGTLDTMLLGWLISGDPLIGIQIGAYNNTEHYDGVMSQYHCIDGTAYDATAFGETDATSGIWKIKTSPSVTYGTKGYFILKDGAGLTDQSGNSNNFTLGAGTLTATKDNPSNNFITLNPLGENAIYTSGTHDLLNGNTTFDPTNTSYFSWSAGSLGVSASKWYWEVKFSGTPGGDWPDIGFIKTEFIKTMKWNEQ